MRFFGKIGPRARFATLGTRIRGIWSGFVFFLGHFQNLRKQQEKVCFLDFSPGLRDFSQPEGVEGVETFGVFLDFPDFSQPEGVEGVETFGIFLDFPIF